MLASEIAEFGRLEFMLVGVETIDVSFADGRLVRHSRTEVEQ